MRLSFFLCSAIAIGLLASAARSQETAALINQALDQRVHFSWETPQPMPQVLEAIREQTGVPLEVHPSVYELLPWGQQTTIQATLHNLTLREALRAVTRQLGLTYVLREEVIQIRPMPALARLGRRSTASELQLLALLAREPMNLETDRPTVAQLIEAVDQRLMQHRPVAEEPPPFDVEHRAHAVVPDDQVVFVPRNATMMAALESLAAETSATWYPWERSVLIIPKEQHTRAKLSRTITTRFEGVEVSQVLTELSQRSGVPFTIEPGAVQRIPAESRVIRLTLENATYIQALENLAGFTGLGFLIRAEDVYIWHQATLPTPAPRDPVVGIITIPELGIQVPVTESQVPEDVRQYLRHKTRQELEKVRELMVEENFSPGAD
jgi:hypothetical protein